MKRRDLFKLAGPAAAALALPALAPAKDAAPAQDPLSEMEVYRGFRLKWRGWFTQSNSDSMVGQWIAYNPLLEKGIGFSVYSSYPGDTRAFYGDQLFDTTPKEDQENVPRTGCPPEKLEEFQTCAKKSLFKFIDEHYDELVTIHEG